MYSLLPWRWLASLVGAVVAITLYVDDIAQWLGIEISGSHVVRFLPLLLLTVFSAFFGPTCYWAPWRFLWRRFPTLNNVFPDLNGVWVGSTSSNWPTIKKLIDSAKNTDAITSEEISAIPDQCDAIALQIKNSLFMLHIQAGLSSTDARSHSITATPWRHQHTNVIHISYIYEQNTPHPAATDEERHLGAADLALVHGDAAQAEGTYWTRRQWRDGRNTAGKIKLTRLSSRIDKHKTLQQHAKEHNLRK